MRKFSLEKEVVLCGFNGFNAYGMLRSLGEAGIRPILVTDKCAVPFLTKSKYIKKDIFYFDSIADFIEIVREKILDKYNQPIIICCEDKLQSALDLHYDELKNKCLLSNSAHKQGEITRLMEKDVQMKVAEASGVITPRTWLLRQGSIIPQDMVYPCIAKPFISIAGTKEQIRVCHNAEELTTTLQVRDYLVQEFVEKDYEVIIWGTSVGEDQYYMPGVARKLRQYPDDNNLSSFGVLESFDQHPKLNKDALLKFLRALQYTGMFSIEMAVKDEKYYMLEINLRNDGKQYFSTAAGANLPLMYINSLLGNGIKDPMVKYPTYFMGETTDFKQILRKKVTPLGWIKDLCRTDSFFIFNWKDPIPFVYSVKGKLLKH